MALQPPVVPTKTSLISIDTIIEQGSVRANARVADLGCGRSLFFLYALSTLVGKNGLVYGVDVLPEVVESAERDISHHRLASIKMLRADLEPQNGVPLPTGSIDAAFLINTLHQSHNSLAMMTEALRLVKKGGHLVIVDWSASLSPLGPKPSQRLAHEHVIEMAEMIGTKRLDKFNPGLYHYGITVTK